MGAQANIPGDSGNDLVLTELALDSSREAVVITLVATHKSWLLSGCAAQILLLLDGLLLQVDDLDGGYGDVLIALRGRGFMGHRDLFPLVSLVIGHVFVCVGEPLLLFSVVWVLQVRLETGENARSFSQRCG